MYCPDCNNKASAISGLHKQHCTQCGAVMEKNEEQPESNRYCLTGDKYHNAHVGLGDSFCSICGKSTTNSAVATL